MIAVGCDISQNTIDVQIIDKNEIYIKINNNIDGFQKLMNKLPESPSNYHICMEATGNYYEDFADYMAEQGYQVTVVNPLKISKFAEAEFQKTKTDKQDCKLIAQYCQEKLLKRKGSYQKPTEQQYQVKRLLSYVRQLKEDKVRLENRLTSAKDEFIRSQLKQQIDEQKKYIKAAHHQIETLTGSQAKERLKSVPSIGEKTAQVLIHFLTMFQFKSANQFVAFAGLSPQQRKSGTSVNKKEKLSRYGNRILKSALYMAAVVAYRIETFRGFVNNLEKRGKGGKLVIVAIMRKLAALAFTLHIKGESYRVREIKEVM